MFSRLCACWERTLRANDRLSPLSLNYIYLKYLPRTSWVTGWPLPLWRWKRWRANCPGSSKRSENKMVIHFQQGLGLALFWYRNACKASRSYLFYPMLSGNLPIRNLERESFTALPNSFLLEIMNTWFEGVNLLSVPTQLFLFNILSVQFDVLFPATLLLWCFYSSWLHVFWTHSLKTKSITVPYHSFIMRILLPVFPLSIASLSWLWLSSACSMLTKV